MNEFLTMHITYKEKECTFDIDSDIKPEFYSEVIEGFLHMQMGQGADNRKPNIQDTYRYYSQILSRG